MSLQHQPSRDSLPCWPTWPLRNVLLRQWSYRGK